MFQPDEHFRRSLEWFAPQYINRIVECKELGEYEWLLTLDDGSQVIYDELIHSTRELRKDRDAMSDEDVSAEFSRRLKRRMRTSTMTQSDLAEKIGVSQPSLSLYMNGKVSPNMHVLRKLAQVFKCTIDDLIY